MSSYKLQVLLPCHSSINTSYIEGSDYWNCVAESSDLDYLRSQKSIMDHYWKCVRIIQEREVVIEEKVIE